MESAVLIQNEFDVVIGLETHVQMSTNTKMFCGCRVEFAAPPNTNVCPVCLAHPGALPVMNKQAVEYAVKAALALNCQIHNLSIMARKTTFILTYQKVIKYLSMINLLPQMAGYR